VQSLKIRKLGSSEPKLNNIYDRNMGAELELISNIYNAKGVATLSDPSCSTRSTHDKSAARSAVREETLKAYTPSGDAAQTQELPTRRRVSSTCTGIDATIAGSPNR